MRAALLADVSSATSTLLRLRGVPGSPVDWDEVTIGWAWCGVGMSSAELGVGVAWRNGGVRSVELGVGVAWRGGGVSSVELGWG